MGGKQKNGGRGVSRFLSIGDHDDAAREGD